MDTSRATALALAFLAALFVIIAGKSCAENINEANKLARKQNATASETTVQNTYNKYYDEHLRNQETSETVPEITTEKNYVEITNMFHEVIETSMISTDSPPVTTTEQKSILDGYNDRRKQKEEQEASEHNKTETTTFDISGIEVPSQIEIHIN